MVIDIQIHSEELCPKEVINRLHKATKSNWSNSSSSGSDSRKKTVNCKHAPLEVGNVGNVQPWLKRTIKTTTTVSAEYSIMIIIFATESNLWLYSFGLLVNLFPSIYSSAPFKSTIELQFWPTDLLSGQFERSTASTLAGEWRKNNKLLEHKFKSRIEKRERGRGRENNWNFGDNQKRLNWILSLFFIQRHTRTHCAYCQRRERKFSWDDLPLPMKRNET